MSCFCRIGKTCVVSDSTSQYHQLILDQGLDTAIKSVYDKATDFLCIQEIKETISGDFGERAMKQYVSAIHAETAEEYQAVVDHMRNEHGERLHDYLNSLDVSKFVKHKSQVARYGRYTTVPMYVSNEETTSDNSHKILGIGVNLNEDHQPNYRRILRLLEEVWDDQMSLRPDRLNLSQIDSRLSPTADQNIIINREQGMNYRCKSLGSINADTEVNGEVTCRFPNVDGKLEKRIVKLWPLRRTGWCSCLEYREMGYPCCHAMKVIMENNLEINE